MPGFLAIIGPTDIDESAFSAATGTLDLVGGARIDTVAEDGVRLAVASLPDAPFGGPYLHRSDTVIGGFAGDLFSRTDVP